MKIDTSLPKDEKGLSILLKTLVDASRDRALWAITQRRMNVAEIVAFDGFMLKRLAILWNESTKFLSDAENFVETFVLEDNKCIEKDGILFKDMHRSMVGVRKILVKTSPYHGMHSYQYRNVTPPNVYETSLMSGASPKSDDLFGIESFSDEVKSLCTHISEYFNKLYGVIRQCFHILREEKAVKKDPKLCEFYYQQFARSVIDEFMKAMELYNITPANLNNMVNPLYSKRAEYGSETEFVQYLYHNDSPTNVKAYILQSRFCGKTANDMTPEEKVLFGSDYEKVKNIRYAIVHFDEVAHKPQRGDLTLIKGKDIACFAFWCGIDNSKPKVESFYSYFEKEYNKCVNKVAIAGCERVYKNMRTVTNEARNSFNSKLNVLFEQKKTAEMRNTAE